MNYKEAFQKVWDEVAQEIPDVINTPSKVLPVIAFLTDKKTEHFAVVTLDAAHKVISMHITSQGILNKTLVHPREVFIDAITDNSATIILAHNHPSGALDPSKEDDEITERLVKAGELLGIPVLDHIIVGNEGYYSYQENGKI